MSQRGLLECLFVLSFTMPVFLIALVAGQECAVPGWRSAKGPNYRGSWCLVVVARPRGFCRTAVPRSGGGDGGCQWWRCGDGGWRRCTASPCRSRLFVRPNLSPSQHRRCLVLLKLFCDVCFQRDAVSPLLCLRFYSMCGQLDFGL